jgi:hypothetical protein
MVNSSRATALVKVETKKEKRLPTGLPRDLILTTLDDNNGNVDQTAKALSINYAALGNYIDNDPEMRALTVRHREAILDNAEDQLRTSIQSGNMTSVRFALSTLGRERGYVQRTEKDIRTQDIPSPKSVDISQLSVDQLKLLAEIMESTEPH